MNHSSYPLACPLAMGVVLAVLAAPAQPALEVDSVGEIQSVFAGAERQVKVTFRNRGSATAQADLRIRLYQTATATSVLSGERAWKSLRVLPGQTVIEIASLDFPVVRVQTEFVVQWLASTNTVLGRTKVLVYPTNLLADLRPLAGDKPIGVLDPQNELKPLFKNLAVEFENLDESVVSSFPGKLAILGPFPSRAQMPEGLADRIAMFARKGGAVVWLVPPRERDRKLMPTFYTVPLGEGLVVVAQARLAANLATDPAAQLNLIHLAEYAVRREPMQLPEQTP